VILHLDAPVDLSGEKTGASSPFEFSLPHLWLSENAKVKVKQGRTRRHEKAASRISNGGVLLSLAIDAATSVRDAARIGGDAPQRGVPVYWRLLRTPRLLSQ